MNCGVYWNTLPSLSYTHSATCHLQRHLDQITACQKYSLTEGSKRVHSRWPDLFGALALLLGLLHAHQRGPAQRRRLELRSLRHRVRLRRPHSRARRRRHRAARLLQICTCCRHASFTFTAPTASQLEAPCFTERVAISLRRGEYEGPRQTRKGRRKRGCLPGAAWREGAPAGGCGGRCC